MTKLVRFATIREEASPKGLGLAFDLLVDSKSLLVEVQGIQHRQFCPFFHKSVADFNDQKRRDRAKTRWAEENGYTLIVLHDNEQDRWTEQIQEFLDALKQTRTVGK